MTNTRQAFHSSAENISTGHDIIQWLDSISSLLHNSRWAPALTVYGVDVLDGLRPYIYMSLASLARDDSVRQGMKMPSTSISWLMRKRQAAIWRWQHLTTKLGSATWRPVSVVFWPWQSTHLKPQIPVAHALDALNIPYQFLVNHPHLYSHLKKQGIKSVYLANTWGNFLVEAHKHGQQIAQLFKDDPGIELPALAGSHDEVVSALREPIVELLPLFAESLIVTDLIVECISPQILVVGNDMTIAGKAGCIRGRQHSLLTACLMHGSVAGDPLQSDHKADKFLVYGNANYNQLVNVGVEPSRIEITGAPYLDDLPHQSGKIHPDICKRLRLSNEIPVILVLTSGPGHTISYKHHLITIEHIMWLSSQYPDVTFIAKLHRKDKLAYYQQVEQIVPNSRLKVIADGMPGYPQDIFDWLQGCKLILTGASSVAIESMLMNVPVVTMDFANELANVDFINAGATMHVRSRTELAKSVGDVLRQTNELNVTQKRAKQFLEHSFLALDGNSAKRAAQVIVHLMKQVIH